MSEGFHGGHSRTLAESPHSEPVSRFSHRSCRLLATSFVQGIRQNKEVHSKALIPESLIVMAPAPQPVRPKIPSHAHHSRRLGLPAVLAVSLTTAKITTAKMRVGQHGSRIWIVLCV
jgi:hypothetical protein